MKWSSNTSRRYITKEETSNHFLVRVYYLIKLVNYCLVPKSNCKHKKLLENFAQGIYSTSSNVVARTAKITLHNLTSIYIIRYFEGDPAIHEDVPFQLDVQNQYATSLVDHFTNTLMMSTSTFDFFSTNLRMLNIEEGQTS